MEFDENNAASEPEDNYIDIYSKRAVLWFSILASPLFGGVLLLLNLKAAGFKQAFYIVLGFMILITIAADISLNEFMLTHKFSLTVPSSNLFVFYSISVAFNTAGGLILAFYFFKKYFPDNDYYPKSIVTPVIVTVLAVLILRIIGFGI